MSAILGDRNARKRIILGTLGLGAAGGAIGLNVAILKNLQPIARHTATMAGNWSLCGLFFFTTREALLAEQREKNQAMNLRISQTRENDEMFSSALAGALTGGTLAFISRGRRKSVVSGAVFFGLVAVIGQFAFTKFNHRRQQIIIREMAAENKTKQQGNIAVETADDEAESMSIIARVRRAVSVDPITLLPEWFPLRRIPRRNTARCWEEVRFELRRLRSIIDDLDRREQNLMSRLQQD
ncbi:hypothetical protein BX661DRAFT_186555 [Kickxella alabastrina]|uniref:uncharacterized protein n=1 Tax=Kickxella alabastrina TaxID=61397 RepID=UPI00221ED56A|nr:uncharacterized protein BX661DRAFT_186555 [Kickxella alabastrina]KAI7823415.1 hypothetical protein BX661DRAFT_186555 [Kickxella alabastrina]